MSETNAGVVIIGAGHAGGTAAALLRQYGYEAPITLIGEEPIAPYQRPPLSKAWLKGEADADSLALKPFEFYAETGIELILNAKATEIRRTEHTVSLADGRRFAYEALIIATGARARALPIPGADLKGVLSLRSAADAEALKAAASARALGAEAVVIEREPRILARVACEILSTFFTDYHRARGVDFELRAMVEALDGEAGRVSGVRLADGRTLACDVALVGVGAPPNDEIAQAAGLTCSGGIVVDTHARTMDPDIFAIGDVSHRPMPHYHRSFRLESVANALEQARQAAAAITGRPPPPPEVTWNWSDQYDLKYQFAGVPFDIDEILLRGDPAKASFAVFHLAGDVIQAVEAVNAPAEFMAGRRLIGQRQPISRTRLADTAVSMKEVAA
jgi:3-phenylpropionate/trans-cinnamate dioxygenase ferredoxin reductase subunit